MTCKLCGRDVPLVRAHIIPDAFNKDLVKESVRPAVMMANDPAIHPKRRPGGHYDENLICGECERRFQDYDDYAAEFFLDSLRNDASPLFGGLAFEIGHVDFDLLKLFAISLAWRASATEIAFFSRIDLGPYEAAARERILVDDPGPDSDFQILLTRWVTKPELNHLADIQFSPYTAKMAGVNNLKFFLAGSVLHIKVDKRAFPAPLPQVVLKRDQPLVVLSQELEGSKDLEAMKPALSNLQARYGAKPGP